MDSFNLQAEKANAILKYRKLRRIASLLRLVEVCVILVLISRLSLKLPVAVRNSSEYFRDLSLFMNSPRFVFLIGNVIIITLFAQFSAQCSGRNVPEPDLYQELVQNTEKQRIKTDDGGIENRRINGDVEKFPENQGINQSTVVGGNGYRMMKNQRMKTGDANNGLEVKKCYRRCETEISRKRRRVLRRCETENRRKSIEAAPGEEMARITYPQDDMSNEEFRRTVEAFIARQQRIRRQED